MVVFRTRPHIDQLYATDRFLRIFSAPLKTVGRQLEAQAQRSVHVFLVSSLQATKENPHDSSFI